MFDTVSHSILLSKLSAMSDDDVAHDWFDSFLSNRREVTCCYNAMSDTASVTIGVAQGSILGPLLFIIYMNDLPDILDHCRVTLYADDTVLYFTSKSVTKVDSDLSRVCSWFRANRLTLNIKK